MARPKGFDRDLALLGAMEIFQAKGFEGTSIQDLVEGLGINRQSLYDTFGDKEALYHEALERYRRLTDPAAAGLLEGPLPLRRALANLLEQIIDRLTSPSEPPCFIAQAALERAAEDPVAARCVAMGFHRSLRSLEARLRRAQAEGELGAHHDPGALALALQNALNGLQITARSGTSRPDLEAIARVTLSLLG